jgi:hypothetical protein
MTARASARRIAWRTAPGNVSQRRSWSSREPGSSERQVTPWGCSPGELAGHPGGRQSCSSLRRRYRVLVSCSFGGAPSVSRRSRGRGSKGQPPSFVQPSTSVASTRERRHLYKGGGRAPPVARGGEDSAESSWGEPALSTVCVEMGGGGAGGALAHPPAADHPQVRLWASWNRTSTRGTGRPEDACAIGGSFHSGFGADERGLACGRNGERGEPPRRTRAIFTTFPPEAVLPTPLHRRRCGFQTPARLQDLDLACVPAPASGSQCSGRIGCFACDSRRSPRGNRAISLHPRARLL